MNEALVVCVRGIISFFTLLIFTRFLGKQQIGEITFFDYILGITIGSFAASLTVDLSSAAWPHWIGLLTWILLGLIMQYISLKYKKVSNYINDRPMLIIYNGKILGDNLKSTKFTLNELVSQLRLKDIFDISKIKLAVIETNGQLSAINNEQFTTLIKDINIPKENNYQNNELIFSGVVIEENLLKYKLNYKWLSSELSKQGFDQPSEIFLAFLDPSKKLIINSYNSCLTSKQTILK